MGKKLNNALSNLKFDAGRRSQLLNEENHEIGKIREFCRNEFVWVRNYANGPKWLRGMVTRRRGPVTYEIDVKGRFMQRHVDQLWKCTNSEVEDRVGDVFEDNRAIPKMTNLPNPSESTIETREPEELQSGTRSGTLSATEAPSYDTIPERTTQPAPADNTLRRSTRNKTQTTFYGV